MCLLMTTAAIRVIRHPAGTVAARGWRPETMSDISGVFGAKGRRAVGSTYLALLPEGGMTQLNKAVTNFPDRSYRFLIVSS
jgi:hypothetical protein